MTVKTAKIVAEYFIAQYQKTETAPTLKRVNAMLYFTYAWWSLENDTELYPIYAEEKWVSVGEKVDNHILEVIASGFPVNLNTVKKVLGEDLSEYVAEVWLEYGGFNWSELFHILHNDAPLQQARLYNENMRVNFEKAKETYNLYASYSLTE